MDHTRTMKNRISKKSRIDCFRKALPSFLKDAAEYEKNKFFPNDYMERRAKK